ncbi:MAG: hypothetical protein JWM20_299 [Patescibacteria group bacterium]|nr:hypothetical protein [Patescibacteria group bacterium]
MEPNFLQDLVAKFDIGEYPADEQHAILDEMSQIIMESVLTRAIPLLPVEAAIEYDKMLAADADITEIFTFLQMSVPGFDEIVAEEVATLEKMLKLAKG